MNNVKKYRNLLGISQLTLAERARCARSYISSIELGQQKLTLKMATKISTVLHVSPYELLGSDAVKYEGTFYESMLSLVDGNFDMVIRQSQEKTMDDLSWEIYWIVFDILKNKMDLSDLKVIRAVVESIAKKYSFDGGAKK